MKIGIFLGSIRKGRAGEAVARWVSDAAEKRDGFEYERLDLSEFNVPLLDAEMVPGAANKQYEDEATTAWSKAVDACDAFIFVTPEYNHSVPGAMKNAFDVLGAEWAGKPVAFVSYGADNGLRAVEHWRQIVANFSMFGVRNQVALSLFEDFADGAFAPREQKHQSLENVLNDLEQALS
ncbi:NADPH-dependent FMN reductase [Corynebacterium hadale]|uniref:NADPH-dependent FMN reductase n=1 Tax=Corynebacterium hadale TaxID=2026255 RepID=A0ABX4H982_9CORY|nr:MULTISPECIES: NAD(P)H-dependent oxidoreductase [Corynebacterium]PAT05870.1 NADPH-dependent FMN reductase [Corynebacterium hadale]PAT11604.1 NADPH-dependent FMN reductase [Corynebacterium hadale]TVX80345.1 NAD(P)H-dependent oxidoreductase [Corynebacterium sp. NML180780]